MTVTLIDTRGRAGTDDTAAPVVSGCSVGPRRPATRSPSAPPIFVDGVEIAEEEIAREIQHHPGGAVAEARAEAARALVIRRLLLARASLLGLTPDPQTDALGRWETDDEALVRQVIEAEVDPQEPTDAEIDRVISAHPPPASLKPHAARHAVRDRLRARAWLGASTRYVAGLARAARIEGLSLWPEEGEA
jgi:peptidyl-prolyl cis-trans isomerase C